MFVDEIRLRRVTLFVHSMFPHANTASRHVVVSSVVNKWPLTDRLASEGIASMRISIGFVLACLSGVMLLISCVQGAFSISSLHQIRAGIETIVGERVPAFILLGEMNAGVGDVRNVQSTLVNASADQRTRLAAQLATAKSDLAADFTQYEQHLVDQADKQYFSAFRAKWEQADKNWTTVSGLLEAGKVDEARALFIADALTAYNGAKEALQGAVDDMAADVNGEGAATNETANAAALLNYISLGIAVIVGIAAVIFGNLFLARPLKGMATVMGQLSNGDTSIDIPGRGRKDEVGAMAGAVEVFRQGAIEKKKLEAEADANRANAEAQRIATQQKAEADAGERLRIATSGLATGLRRLASGDLAFALNDKFAPEFEPLREDFNRSVQQLGGTLLNISRSIETMNAGTQEIASSSLDLSRRTEQQAATLEETAAALDEITVNVRNSTKRADEAKKAAVDANEAAHSSGEVVVNAVDAMQRIEQSSGQISNIITVIDEIAFQTNLLALNAGVEAARAGDAGKGFAVVAQEVRELAQRSAKAAKDIKELISKSSGDVANGVKLVRQTGESLKTIESYVAAVNGHMGAIASSAQEQATGLAEVNTAVNQMDQTTQQNAAMVEETTSATSALASESDKLRELLGQFQLGENSGYAPMRMAS